MYSKYFWDRRTRSSRVGLGFQQLLRGSHSHRWDGPSSWNINFTQWYGERKKNCGVQCRWGPPLRILPFLLPSRTGALQVDWGWEHQWCQVQTPDNLWGTCNNLWFQSKRFWNRYCSVKEKNPSLQHVLTRPYMSWPKSSHSISLAHSIPATLFLEYSSEFLPQGLCI